MVEIKCMQLEQGKVQLLRIIINIQLFPYKKQIGKQIICEAENRWMRLVAKTADLGLDVRKIYELLQTL